VRPQAAPLLIVVKIYFATLPEAFSFNRSQENVLQLQKNNFMKNESETLRLAQPVNDKDHVLGAPSAPATLVEYGDYECIYCRQLHPMLQEIMSRTEGVRLVYRHFPISKVHPHAERAIEAAEAADAQGRFWQMHDALFEQDHQLDDKGLARSARKAGLDMERYTREMAEGIYAGRGREAFKTALYGGGVTGTPTLYLNEVRFSNIQSLEALLEAVITAGATFHPEASERAGWLSRLRNFRRGMTRLHLL
jgi:protein-disulfide isomerase